MRCISSWPSSPRRRGSRSAVQPPPARRSAAMRAIGPCPAVCERPAARLPAVRHPWRTSRTYSPHPVEALRDRNVARLRRSSALHRIFWLLANSCTGTDGALHAQPIPLRWTHGHPWPATSGRGPSMDRCAGSARRAVRLTATLLAAVSTAKAKQELDPRLRDDDEQHRDLAGRTSRSFA